MSEKYYQCCYTNAEVNVGGAVSSGWQAVAVSPGIPSDVLNACTSVQVVNSTIQGSMVDEAGRVLDLYEIWADDTYVYTMRSKYGMIDRLGRPNMFAHALVFDWRGSGALYNPNVFLSIDAANYKSNAEEAAALKSSLSRTKSISIDTALAEAGISHESYLTLIRCVYAKMTERSLSHPVFVQYDGTDRQMHFVLYCVYWGLPYFLRRALRVASVESNNAINRDLIFSVNAHTKRCFVDPQTGENNVLNRRLGRKIERYAFADYAVANLEDVDEETYFKKLECVAVELGDATASNPLILKIAHLHIMGYDAAALSNDEVEERISDALRSRASGSQRMDAYIAELLNQVVRRGMVLTEENAACLADKVAASHVVALAQADEKYTIHRLSALPAHEAAHQLARLNRRTFKRYSNRLLRSDEGKQILDCYYAEVALGEDKPSWEAFNTVLKESERLGAHPQTSKRIYDLASKLYEESLDDLPGAVSEFESYSELLGRVVSAEEARKCIDSARAAFWQRVRFDTFDFGRADDLQAMDDDSSRADMFCKFPALLAKVRNGCDAEDILGTVQQYFETYSTCFNDQKERAQAVDVILDLLKESYTGDDKLIAKWIMIAVDASSSDVFGKVLNVRHALYNDRYANLMDDYRELHKRSWGMGNEPVKRTLHLTAELICEYCARMERWRPNRVTPLDIWLLVGDDLCQNRFEVFDSAVFDECDAAVLTAPDSGNYALRSELFTWPIVKKDAEQYARSGGRAARVVKVWLKAAKKQERSTRGGFFGLRGRTEDEYFEEAQGPKVTHTSQVQGVMRAPLSEVSETSQVLKAPQMEVPQAIQDESKGTWMSRVPYVDEPEGARHASAQGAYDLGRHLDVESLRQDKFTPLGFGAASEVREPVPKKQRGGFRWPFGGKK